MLNKFIFEKLFILYINILHLFKLNVRFYIIFYFI